MPARYKCLFCDKEYLYSNSRIKHMKVHHPQYTATHVVCRVCGCVANTVGNQGATLDDVIYRVFRA